jgi:putative membrane protein
LLTALHMLVFWAWHAPPLYSAALSSDALFWAMQASLLGSATLWWARLRQAEAGAAVIALLATMVLMGLLAALLIFAGSAFYEPHWLTTQAWGFSPLEDQQLAGILMWVPGSAIYLLVALTVLYRSLRLEPAR